MPTVPHHPCYHPACGALVSVGAYCPTHARTRKAERVKAGEQSRARRNAESPALALAIQIRNTSAWRKARESFKAQRPICCDPFAVHGASRPVLTSDAHHIVSLAERPDLAFEASNLAPLCIRCHARVEGMERAGKPTAYLFRFLPEWSAGIGLAAKAELGAEAGGEVKSLQVNH